MIPKIINFCPTGTQTTKLNSYAPIFENEIIEDVLKCNEVGITMVHLHARDENGENTYKKSIFQRIIEGIKKNIPDLIIGVSLSGRYFSDNGLRTEVLALKPDLGSLTMSSLNFQNSASINSPETILYLINEMEKYGVHPEIECFDSGMLNYTQYLINKGILSNTAYINIILGNIFNAGTDISSVSSIINNLPKESKVCFGGIGKHQLKSNILGLLEADGVRIGLEDNLYFVEKEKATNMQLIERMHRIMNELNYTCMDSLTLKKIGFANKRTDSIR
jgi:3-keto-5-aminohexanoate cleavage enzyme